MDDPRVRDDLSKFLVHLTRNYDGATAEDNLTSILRTETIEARTAHCLFSQKIRQMPFSDLLARKFNTVCLTETPLTQIQKLLTDLPGRKVKLKPYGLVFWREGLSEEGANPAIYINAKGTNLRDYLLHLFEEQFYKIKKYSQFRKREAFYQEIIQYYSLINVISHSYDFAWEREWRFYGDLEFQYRDLVAIIAPEPDSFKKSCEKRLSQPSMKLIERTPIISPYWSYEDIVEQMAFVLWRVKK